MFFLIPTGTDAPVYYWPWATVLLIGLNVVAFAITGGGYTDLVDPWILEFGNGLHSFEWLSSIFVHFGLMHLLGNMIFLWGFGIVVEGKIGWWKFLSVYLAIGLSSSAILQVIMLDYSGPVPGIGGASGVIFGLMAIALVWAPKNEVTLSFIVFIFVFFRVYTFEATILACSLFYIGMNVLFAWLQGFEISSEMAHLLGAAIGFSFGAAMLKLKWVDCENWDLFAVLTNTYGTANRSEPYGSGGPIITAAAFIASGPFRRTGKRSTKQSHDDDAIDESEKRQASLLRMRRLLQGGKSTAAMAEYRKASRLLGAWKLGEPDLLAMADGLYASRTLREAVPVMEEYIQRFPGHADRMRIKLASILVQDRRRPKYALRVLDPIVVDCLPEPLVRHLRKVQGRARQMIDAGLIELDGEM